MIVCLYFITSHAYSWIIVSKFLKEYNSIYLLQGDSVVFFISLEWLLFINIKVKFVARCKYTSQQKKRYKGLMLIISYIEKKNRQKSYNLDSYGHNK